MKMPNLTFALSLVLVKFVTKNNISTEMSKFNTISLLHACTYFGRTLALRIWKLELGRPPRNEIDLECIGPRRKASRFSY